MNDSWLSVTLQQLANLGQQAPGTGGDGTPFGGSNVIVATGGVLISASGQGLTDTASVSSSEIANGLWRPYYASLMANFNDIPVATDIWNSPAGLTPFPTAPQVPIEYLNGSSIFTNPSPTFTDPLLLDLTGAGINVSNWIQSPVYFDTNVVPDANGNPTTTPDGLQHETAWAKPGTGILVFEASGVVTPITNITQTVSEFLNAGPTPARYADGLAALASLVQTDPATGLPYTVFNAQTAAIDPTTHVSYWNEIMVWKDANHNGVSDAGEVVSLNSLGITSISLVGSGNQGESINGSAVTNRTTFTKTDGTIGQAAAVNFQNDSIGNIATTVTGGIVIKSLSEGGPTLATTFVSENTSAHTYSIQNGKLTDTTTGAVIATTGITAVLSSSQNDVISVAASDTGTYWLGGGTGADTLTGGGGTNVFLVNPNTVVHGGTGANSFNIAKVIGTQGVTIDLATEHLNEVIGGAGGSVFNASGTTWNVFIQATSGNNIIIGGAATDALSGGTGDDLIELGPGGGVVHAGQGNDVIYGGSGASAMTQPQYVNAGGSSNAAYVERLFNGALGKEADLASFQANVAGLNNGSLTKTSLATAILSSTAGQTLYASMNNTQFTNAIFQGLLGRLPSTSELNNFVSGLNSGQTRGVALQTLASGSESQAYWGGRHPGASDVIYAGPGNDIVTLGTNNSEVFAGTGSLTVIGNAGGFSVLGLHGSYADYTLAHNADGTITVTNTNNMDGDGTVTMKNVTALDFSDISQVAVATTTGLPVNDQLNTGNAAQVTTNGSGQYVIAAATLLQNDLNYAGGTLAIQNILDNANVAHAVGSAATVNGGTVTLNANGTITFTPTPGYTGLMSFRYNLVNGTVVQQVGTSNTAPLSATVYLNTPGMPTDPLFDSEWFLQAADVIPVWKDYTGAGVSIGIFDPSGNVDFSNPDLAQNAGQSFKIDGTPGVETTGTHATLVAGVIGAANNGRGGVGVAYGATISSEALPTDGAGNLRNVNDWVNYDIVNNSWGISPPFADSFFTNANYAAAYQNAAENGRNGLGTIMVFAGGNNRAILRNTNDLNETNNDFGITVGGINATTDLGSLVISGRPFSTPGVSILVSAPANNITSTGVNFTNQYGQQFGASYQTTQGTSFATPIVSGVVALMLEANPGLGYRDVQQILAETAIKVSDPNTTWQTNSANFWNGGGLHYSSDYGYGEVDARAAVRLAESWIKQQTFSNQLDTNWLQSSAPGSLLTGFRYSSGGLTLQSGDITTPIIATNSTTAFHGYNNVRYVASSNLTLEDVEVNLDLDITTVPLAYAKVILAPYHLSQSNIQGTIINQYIEGTESVLLNDEGPAPSSNAIVTESDGHQHLQFQLNSVAYMGVQSASTDLWVVRVVDTRTGQDIDTAVNWQLLSLGSPTTDPKQWIFTDEYAGGATINPATTGDSFNASAATGNDILDLRSGSTDSRIDNLAVNVGAAGALTYGFGGDGNDTIYGNNSGDTLDGGRGTNVLNGGTGNDTFGCEFGSNTVNGGGGQDIVSYFLATNGVTANLTTGVVNKAGGLTDHLTNVQSIVGSNFDDVLTDGPNTRFLAGEEGNNTYIVTNLNTIVESTTTGTDTVKTALASYVLPTNVKTLIGTAATGQALTGNMLNNTISAGAGSTLTGGGGYDTYDYTATGGALTIKNGVAGDASVRGELDLGSGLNSTNLWFQQVGTNLQITVLGTSNQVTVNGWFANTYSQLAYLVLPDGSKIATTAVTGLAGAMTAYASAHPTFNPQAAGQTMPADSALTTALNTNWSRTITGTSGNDTLVAGYGSDLLAGNIGNDTLIGGNGADTAVYRGNKADYIIQTNSAGVTTITDTVAGRDGTDTLTGIEFLQFADATVPVPPALTVVAATGNAGTAIPLTISSALTSSHGTEIISIAIVGLPSLATLSAGTRNEDGSWTLTSAQLAGLSLITPAGSFAGIANLAVTATATGTNGSHTSTSANLAVAIAGVATAPTLSVQNAWGIAGSTAIPLSIASALTATDGQESLSLKITGVPSVAALSAGTRNADGSWTLTPTQLSGLSLADPAGGFAGTANLAITATATEADGSTASTSANLPVTIAAAPLVGTTIESFGSTGLVQAGSGYYLTTISTGFGPQLYQGGALVTVGQFGSSWAPIGVEQVAGGGYDVAWHNSSSGNFIVWSVDSNGNYLSDILFSLSANNITLEALETTFQQDLNGDGSIGITKVVIQTDGPTALTEVANTYYYLYNGGTGPELTYNGAPVTVGQFGSSWSPIGAVQLTSGGYDVAWHDPSSGLYDVWSTDSNGTYLSDLVFNAPGNNLGLEALETTFQQDLNGDGVVGTKVVIQTDGSTSLTEVANTYYYLFNGSAGPELKYGGAAVTVGQFGSSWAPIGAVQVAGGGYDVAWHDSNSGKYYVWSVGSNGNYVSDILSNVPGIDLALQALETTFGQDLNGDGTIGISNVVIQTDGPTALTKVANTWYYLYNGGNGPELTYNGAPVTVGQFGSGWAPIGAVQVAGGGYDVAWHDSVSGNYYVWSVDSNGNYLSDLVSNVPGSNLSLQALETTFHQDLNGDGVLFTSGVGSTVSAASLVIGASASVELTGGYAGTITFAGATGTLTVDHSANFSAEIGGQLAIGDVIDLVDITAGASATVTYSGNNSPGTLTVSDGTHTASVALLGNYSPANFTASSDGHGGTSVIDPPVPTAQSSYDAAGITSSTVPSETLQLTAAPNNLWFDHVGNDLVVDVLGTEQKVAIPNWYGAPGPQLGSIQAANYSLANNQVDTLVQAMTTFEASFANSHNGVAFDPTTAGPNITDTTVAAAVNNAWRQAA